MDSINIKKISLYQIDVSRNISEKINIDLKKETIIQYVKNLIKEISESPNRRQFRFKKGNTEVKNSIPIIISNSKYLEETLLNNSNRLLEKEVKINKEIKKMGVEVQRGSLLHIHFQENKYENLLICKVEHDEIINEESFEINRGLNTKKRVFKSFLNYLANKDREEEIYVSDKNNSKYWWDDFLELEQVKSDEENTENSAEKIISAITTSTRKKEFELDSTILRNNVIGYFRSNKDFNFTTLVDNIFKDYSSYNNEFPLEKIIEKINKLKEDKSFDKQFSIIPEKIGKNKKNRIKIGSGLSLSIEDYVQNLDKILKPYSHAGVYGMTIISDEAYNFVKEKLNDKGNK